MDSTKRRRSTFGGIEENLGGGPQPPTNPNEIPDSEERIDRLVRDKIEEEMGRGGSIGGIGWEGSNITQEESNYMEREDVRPLKDNRFEKKKVNLDEPRDRLAYELIQSIIRYIPVDSKVQDLYIMEEREGERFLVYADDMKIRKASYETHDKSYIMSIMYEGRREPDLFLIGEREEIMTDRFTLEEKGYRRRLLSTHGFDATHLVDLI